VTVGTSAMGAVMTAVYAALNVAAFTNLSTGGVFNDVPQDNRFPFTWITPGDPAEEPLDTFGKIGATCRVDVHVYSQYEGDDQATDIVLKATELLHHVALSIAGWATLIVVREPVALVVEDVDGVATRHAIAPFTIQVLQS
jgi:hypothetical protein